MKPYTSRGGAWGWRVVCPLLVFLLVCFSAAAQPKPIRLRNETITPPLRANQAALAPGLSAQAPAAGLFLVQLDGPLQPAWRAELQTLGVDLVKYVPDQAFIARLNHVAPGRLQSLSFVRWVGPYRAAHKIHPRLSTTARQALQENKTVAVNILLAPGATPAELTQVRSLLVAVAHESALRQGTFLRAVLSPDRLEALAESSAVLWVERAPKRKLVDELASKIVGGDNGVNGTPTITQQQGFDGRGVTVCVADTGLDSGDTNTIHPDVKGRVKSFHYYTLPDGSDGYGHGTHAAGIVAGNAATGETDPDTGAHYGLGVASGATLVIERIFDENAAEVSPFPSDETLTHDAVRDGAQIGSNSWGNDVQGEYDTDAAQFDELVRDADASTPGDQPYILEFSAGNAGPAYQTVGSPATGKNVLSTGASENVPNTLAMTYGLYADGPDTMADFSSRGPCEDGRIKPDVVAPGTWIASMASAAAPNEASVSWSAIDNYYVYMGGTSMSGPHASGAAAVFVQYYQSLHTNAVPSPALVKAALINSADPLDILNGGPGPIPNQDEGWGRINLLNLVFTNLNTAPRYYDFVDQTVLLTNTQVYTRHLLVQGSDQPLKITLTYTDVPGFPGAIPALVNDLDLEVVGPDGTLYRGNQFAGDDSVPNPSSTDNLNNVEAVHLSHPAPGDYLVRVRARRVVQDARRDTTAVDQDFALVSSGNLARPSAGAILLDRTSYTAPGSIHLTVLDPARAGLSSVTALVKSTTEPAGETYTLNSAGGYGAFTGTVATVVGTATTDGKLQIHDGDSIEADYTDHAGVQRSATAVADLTPPSLTGVTASVDLGILTITWQTSEPADSIVRYSTNLTFNLAVTNSTLTTTHTVRLSKLVPGQTYYFYVTSSDTAGNTATNNNTGAYYTFIAVAPPTVLLVDAYQPVDGSPTIPDSAYTNALAGAGFSFAHWKVSERGSPQLSDLQPFPVVMWRLVDDIVNYGVDADGLPDPSATNNTFSAQQQFIIQSYLNGGGSFFVSSMSLLTQLGDVPFRKQVLQVAGFKQNPDAPSPCNDCDEDFGVPAILGTAGDPISSGVSMSLNYTNYPYFELDGEVYGPDFSDTFTPSTNATPVVVEAASRKACAMSYPRIGTDSPGRVVFLSFPLDTLPANGTAPNTEAAFLGKALKFLVPGANGIGTITLDNNVYTVPAQVIVEVGDSDLAGSGQTQVTFTRSSSTNRVTLTLSETTHPGLFRGYLTLVASNAAPNQLVVQNGDLVTASYFDASNRSNVVATATIDTIPPVITQVSATTSFGDAQVSWTTSKPADSLVQYGESVLLGRTAYNSALVTNHTVTVSGLLANHTYHYQVVSRDQAGNTTVDDNHGALYTFSTLRAPQPPWFDDLESGAPGWKVVPDPQNGSDINWTLGTPHNNLATSAFSGTNAWGSNLQGQNFGFLASSFLYSPIIDLSGFNQVTLSFWHNYNFTSGMETGQLGISTNTSTPPADIPTLASYTSETAGWEEETIDLTPYAGQTIQVVWYYQGVNAGLGGVPQGWLVDDVSITGVRAGGNVVVTKNLGQGSFTLSGLVSLSGNAPSTTFSNLPPGDYTVHFSDVAFYQTPPDQTGTLTNGGTLNLAGTYSFLDANGNGISDSWERYYFGSAATNRTQTTDTDGDGMSDYAEFIAGTDPTNAASKLVFLSVRPLTNKLVQLQWAAVPGRLYQLQSSSLGAQQSLSRPKLSGAYQKTNSSFKLHIDAVASTPYTIQVSTNLTAWNSTYTNLAGGTLDYLDTSSSPRRFYRLRLLSGATNSGGWTPVTDWLQAAANPMSCLVTNSGSLFYRLQVRP